MDDNKLMLGATSSSQQSMTHTSNSQIKVKKNNYIQQQSQAPSSGTKSETPKGVDPHGLVSSVKNGIGSVDILEKLRIQQKASNQSVM